METIVKKKRAPNLTNARIATILDIIDSWRGERFTWDALILSIEAKTQATYTRQALAKHDLIQIAYNSKNKIIAEHPLNENRTKIIEFDEALILIETQRAEIARLKIAENQLLEQFARWAANAYRAGVDYRRLDQDLDLVDRDSSLNLRNLKVR